MSLPANVDVDQTSGSAVVHTFVDEFLPTFAMAAGLMALIWLACVVIAVCGAYLGVLAVLGVRHLILAWRHCLLRRRTVEYQLVIAHQDGATTKVINLDRYRRRRCRRNHPSGHETDPDSDEYA